MTQTADPAAPALPDDVEGLRALLLATLAERDELATQRDELAIQNDRLRHLLLKLKRLQFGAKSERLPEEQMQLALEDLEQAIAAGEAQAEKRDAELRRDRVAKRRANRGALPAHLPRIEITLEPEDTACPCCRAAMAVIGEDKSERLDVIPAQFRVLVTKRPKLACQACDGPVVQAPAPLRLIEGGIPTEAMVSHVVVSRFGDHQPLYRQAQIIGRQGILLDRSTLAFWVGYAAAEVAPVVTRLRELVLSSARILADETVLPVLDPSLWRSVCEAVGGNAAEGAAARPRKGISGPLGVMTGPGAAPIRRRWSTRTRLDAATCTPTTCLAATVASCNATAMTPTNELPPSRARTASRWRSAGAMCAEASTTRPKPKRRRSPLRRWSALPLSTGSKLRSAAKTPTLGRRYVMSAAGHSWRRCGSGSRQHCPRWSAVTRRATQSATP